MNKSSKYSKLAKVLKHRRPASDRWLWEYVRVFFGLKIPRKAICDDHNAPFEYLSNSFFCRHSNCICWANRGGGKTQLGALSAMMDSIHTPKCATRVLGGSLEQANKMYEHCNASWPAFQDYLIGEPTQKRTKLKNGSNVEIFAASQKSVRGTHVPKLKIDEVDEVDRDIYEAAIFVAQSANGIPASIENFSTMHKVGGQMSRIIDENPQEVYKWCLWETIEKCKDRTCSQCQLWSDCQGKAEGAEGYIAIDDAIRWMRNTSRTTWEAEALCLRPCPAGIIYPEFDERVNVKELPVNPNLPVYRAIDWGYNYFACLWLQEDKDGNIFIVDEYKGEQKALPINVEAMREKEKPYVNQIQSTYVDPAGKQHNDQTGKQNITVLSEIGIDCKWITARRWTNIVNGVNLVRNFLAPAKGGTRIYVDTKCIWVIQSFQSYAWKEINDVYLDEPQKNTPWEHPMDALRYYFVNRHTPSDVQFYS